jgi:hypothetical protein
MIRNFKDLVELLNVLVTWFVCPEEKLFPLHFLFEGAPFIKYCLPYIKAEQRRLSFSGFGPLPQPYKPPQRYKPPNRFLLVRAKKAQDRVDEELETENNWNKTHKATQGFVLTSQSFKIVLPTGTESLAKSEEEAAFLSDPLLKEFGEKAVPYVMLSAKESNDFLVRLSYFWRDFFSKVDEIPADELIVASFTKENLPGFNSPKQTFSMWSNSKLAVRNSSAEAFSVSKDVVLDTRINLKDRRFIEVAMNALEQDSFLNTILLYYPDIEGKINGNLKWLRETLEPVKIEF